MGGARRKPFLATVFLFCLVLELALPLAMGLSGRWIPNGKKPAPFSKKYRDKHGIKSPAGGGSGGEQSAPSDTKMLMFFGCALGLYFLYNRRGSGSSTVGRATGSATGRGRRTAAASLSMAAPGAVSPPRSFSAPEDQSKSEARLARLKRFATKEGAAANQKAMDEAAKGFCKNGSTQSSGLRQRGANKLSGSGNKKFGTISSLRTDDASSDTNTYDGGNSTLFQGRDDNDEDDSSK